MTKKKKTVLITLAVVAALAVVFCLWYTRPRTFGDLLDGRTVTDLAASGIFMGNVNGEIESRSYDLSQTNQGKKAAQGLIQILAGSRYRASLRSLLPLPDRISHKGSDPILYVSVIMGLDDGSSMSLICTDDQLRIGSALIAAGEDGLTEALYGYLAEHGVAPEAREQLLFE